MSTTIFRLLLVTFCFSIALDFFSQSNINKDYQNYYDKPEASYSTFYKVLKSHKDELISIEKYANEKHNEKFSFKKFATHIVINAKEQRKIMEVLNIPIEDLRNKDNLNSKSVINDIKKKFNISSQEIREIKKFIAFIERFGSPNLKSELNSIKLYTENLECINYTYLELFNDITGYVEFDDFVNNLNYYGLSSNKVLDRVKKLSKEEGCNNLNSSHEFSYSIEKRNDLENKICITSKYDYDDVTIEYRKLNGLILKTIFNEKLQNGNNYFPLISNSTYGIIVVKFKNKILLSFNITNL